MAATVLALWEVAGRRLAPFCYLWTVQSKMKLEDTPSTAFLIKSPWKISQLTRSP